MDIRITVFVLALGVSSPGLAQFSGKVEYADMYNSRIEGLSSASLTEFAGPRRIFYLQGSNYKNVHLGVKVTITLYRGDLKQMLFFEDHADTINWMDARRDTLVAIGELKVLESNVKVLGLPCKMIVITTELGKTTYYFNNKFSINPQNFVEHHAESWNLYCQISRSLPLRITFEGKLLSWESVATCVEPMHLPDSTFALPKGVRRKL